MYGGQRKSWSLVVIDNKEMCVYHYNYLNLNNSGDLFDCVRRFIAYQLGAEGKEIEKTAYRELKFLEIKGDNKLLYKDSGVYMLRKALHLAIGKAEEMQPSLINTYRTELLHLLYEFGAS